MRPKHTKLSKKRWMPTDFDDDLNACAAQVERGDPERFRTVMAAPVAARAVLFPIYAFNLEVARAPYVTQEFLIAEMRLQWWRDALREIADGGAVRRHEVVTPLARVLDPDGADALQVLVDARRRDIEKEQFIKAVDLMAHLDQGNGTLTWVAARALGAEGADAERAARAMGRAAGLANWLRAAPALRKAGWEPMPEQGAEELPAMGLADLALARGLRRHIPGAAMPALRAGWLAGPVLRPARDEFERIDAGALEPSDISAKLRLLSLSLTGRY